jgi:triacylglycerol lipase
MPLDSAAAMGTGRVRTGLVAAVAAIALGAFGASSASAAPLPVSYDFSQGILAQMRAPDSPPPGANDWSCKPTAQHPRPVVLVHGLLANQTDDWWVFSPVIKNQGYCVFSLTYGVKPGIGIPGYTPGGMKTMEESSQELSGFVNKVLAATGAKKVDIVGHSEGSLMPAYYVKYLGGKAKVRTYVGLTTIWHGTNPAGLATLDQLGQPFGISPALEGLVANFCESCAQFLEGSPFINKLRKGGTVTVPGVRYTSIVTQYDELVQPYTSGIETNDPNMTNLVLQQQCPLDLAEHIAVAADPVAAQDVLNALDPAHAAPVPCTVVLPFLGAPLYTGPPR